MKMLLVDPPVDQYFSPFKAGPAFALGLLSIDSYLAKHGYDDVELENFFGCDEQQIEHRLRNVGADVIGMGCTTDSRGFCWDLAAKAKAINPGVKTVLGNVHATFFGARSWSITRRWTSASSSRAKKPSWNWCVAWRPAGASSATSPAWLGATPTPARSTSTTIGP